MPRLTRIFHGIRRESAQRCVEQGARREGDAGIFDNMSRRPNKRNEVDMHLCVDAVESHEISGLRARWLISSSKFLPARAYDRDGATAIIVRFFAQPVKESRGFIARDFQRAYIPDDIGVPERG